eukprot:1152698-Pelagomonas_calceolata.AAC.12
MDYASEQQMELEALEAIYMDELQVRAHNHARTCTQAHACRHAGANVEGKVSIDKWWSTFQVWVTSEHVQIGAHASTRKRTHARTHTHTHTHMRAHTCIRKHTCNQEYCQIKHAYDELPIVWTPVEENKGMPMIYTLVTAAKEWLRGRAAETQQETPEQAQRRLAAEDEAKRAAIRAMGTMVTPENFREWKAKFDAEQRACVELGAAGSCVHEEGRVGLLGAEGQSKDGAGSSAIGLDVIRPGIAAEMRQHDTILSTPKQAKAKALEGLQDTDKARRLTGKQWFMQDKNQAYKEQQHEVSTSLPLLVLVSSMHLLQFMTANTFFRPNICSLKQLRLLLPGTPQAMHIPHEMCTCKRMVCAKSGRFSHAKMLPMKCHCSKIKVSGVVMSKGS